MESLNKRSSVYYSYIIVNLLWYLLIVVTGLLVATIFIEQFFGKAILPMELNIPISPEQVELNSTVDSSLITIDSIRVTLNTPHIKENYFWLYTGLLASFAITFVMYMFGFYQLRMILKSAVNDFVFNKENIKRLRIIAVLLIIIKPFVFSVYLFSLNPLRNYLGIHDLSYSISFDGPGSFVFGLLVFALATIFEKGYKIYQEQQLTV